MSRIKTGHTTDRVHVHFDLLFSIVTASSFVLVCPIFGNPPICYFLVTFLLFLFQELSIKTSHHIKFPNFGLRRFITFFPIFLVKRFYLIFLDYFNNLIFLILF
jgi:hypothetical protein